VFFARLKAHPSVLSEAVKEGSFLLWLRLSQLFNVISLQNPAYEADDDVASTEKNIPADWAFAEDMQLIGVKGIINVKSAKKTTVKPEGDEQLEEVS